ncbi:MAG: XdhC family protein [Planctomycetales bacterium]|nr:XdhC family protein [Planctomycetales bacterium]
MRPILQTLISSLEQQRPVMFCRLVETRGSTPQKPGASMLVYADGTQAGTLGGGCVEAEVKRRALELLSTRRPAVLRFELDHDYGWDDGLICGGRMHVQLEPLDPAGDPGTLAYFRQLYELTDVGAGGTEVVCFRDETADVTSHDFAASCFLFDRAGRPVKQLRAATCRFSVDEIAQHLRPLAERPRPYLAGGLSYLPLLSRCRLLIIGGGHVGQAVAALAADLDFEVWVVDDRESFVTAERFPRATRRMSGDFAQLLREVDITPNTYCLIVTRGHNHDQEALYHVAERGACYVGMIGSRRKIKLIMDNLVEEGISPESLQRVHAPIGIDIGSQTVAEIAVSVAAELVAHRNLAGRIPGRAESAWTG